MITLRSALLSVALTLGSASLVHADCQDDPRMARIGDFLKNKAAGSVEPMALTPDTFFDLTPAVRKAIGQDLTVLDADCSPVQIFDGAPPARLEMPFPTIYNGLYDAAARGDEKSAEIILGAFRAAPLTTEEFSSLLVPVAAPEAIMKRLSDYSGAPILDKSVLNHPGGSECKIKTPTPFIMLSDLYARAGGRIDDGDTPAALVAHLHGGRKFHLLPTKLASDPAIFSGDGNLCSISARVYLGALAKIGGRGFLYESYDFSSQTGEAINAWLAVLKKDPSAEAPLSLFD